MSPMLSLFLAFCDILAAGELSGKEPEHADKYDPAALQPADLQSSRLPGRGQHGAQVRERTLS